MTAIQSMSTANRATASQYSAAMRSMNQSASDRIDEQVVCATSKHHHGKPKQQTSGGGYQHNDEAGQFAQLHIAGQDSTALQIVSVNSVVGTL